MKTQTGILALAIAFILSFFGANLQAGNQHYETATFKVSGNCDMCKKRIEGALKNNTAIKSAEWNVSSKMITVVYNPHSISLDEIHKLIAAAGHDTDKVKADDRVYKKLPGCCKYDRKK